jgi:tetratricopeptide (TPR) repeat protein
MLWPIFRPDFVSPAELFQENIDSALTDLLDARLDSNLAFLRLLESTSSGDMAELFEASRALQSTAVGERALDPLITPYLSRARSLIEQAAQEGPTSQLWGEAQGELAAALLLHPNTVDGAILSAEVSLGVGQTNAANSSFNRALQLAPDNAAAALGVARVAMLRRDLPRAERVLQRARDYHPLNWLIAYNLGVILKEKGDSTRAEELLREAAGLSDDSEASPHTALAELYLSTGEPTRALVEASRAMAL